MGGERASRSGSAGGARRRHSGGHGSSKKHRSRSRKHHSHRGRRHDDAQEDGGSGPPSEWTGRGGGRSSGPPSEWHGCAGGVLHPPPGLTPPPGNHYGPPPPPGYAPGPPPLGSPAYRPVVQYEGVREDPYGAPFSAVPPPPGLVESDRRGGRKGGGKKGCKGTTMLDEGIEAYNRDRSQQQSLPDGLVVSGLPRELNTLDTLNRHFRIFGEVLKITIHASEGKASVQFANRQSAEAAAASRVLDRPEVSLAWAPRAKGKLKGHDGGKGFAPGGKGGGGGDRPVGNNVLVADPQEKSRWEEVKRRKDDIAAQKSQLLGKLTEQMKVIMGKLSDKDMPQAKRDMMRALLLQLKGKMDAVSSGLPPSGAVAAAGGASGAEENGSARTAVRPPDSPAAKAGASADIAAAGSAAADSSQASGPTAGLAAVVAAAPAEAAAGAREADEATEPGDEAAANWGVNSEEEEDKQDKPKVDEKVDAEVDGAC